MYTRILSFLLAFFFVCAGTSQAYWIWTPKSGKWTNPKTAVKNTPADQFGFAKSLFDNKSYEDSRREFKKLIKNYPKAAEAAEAQYYLGMIDEAQNNLYAAFLAFQKVIDKYPFSQRVPEIISKQYHIGELFMAGAKHKAFGVDMPIEHPALSVFEKVAENAPYGPLAAKARYKRGLVFKNQSQFFEAEEEFERVIKNYPDSEWVEPSKFQLAACRAAVARSSDYDQVATAEAKRKFEKFVEDHPDAVLSEDAQKQIKELSLKEAESQFNTGRFYEKQKAFDAARVYYEGVIDNYPDTPWASLAMERLEILEKRR